MSHPDLGVDGRLGAYECVGPGLQLNVLLTHVPFGEETKDFLDTLSLAYRQLSLLAPTIIIGDLNAAPTDDDRTGPPTATDTAVRDAMQSLTSSSTPDPNTDYFLTKKNLNFTHLTTPHTLPSASPHTYISPHMTNQVTPAHTTNT